MKEEEDEEQKEEAIARMGKGPQNASVFDLISTQTMGRVFLCCFLPTYFKFILMNAIIFKISIIS